MNTNFSRSILALLAIIITLLAILVGNSNASAESMHCPHENIRVELIRAVLTFNKAKCVYEINLVGYPVADFCNGIAPQGTRTVKAIDKGNNRIKCVWKKVSDRTREGWRSSN